MAMIQNQRASGLLRGLFALLSLTSSVQALPGYVTGTSYGVPGVNATYDYIVVGGGNAGLTLAARLVEQNAGTVAVIEAGSYYELTNGNTSSIPALDAVGSGKSPSDWQPLVDWGYLTTPQPGAKNLPLHYARGKTLGGSSARNFMVYHRATVGGYQQWADAVGDQSYTFDSFLPWFKKSVNFTEPDMEKRFANTTPSYNISNTGDQTGPLSVSYPAYATAFATWATEALSQMGIPVIPGLLGGNLLGQSYTTSTINADTGLRDSSETSFLRKALPNPNLTVYTLTQAQKILFDADKKATGVLVEIGEKFFFEISARREVVLSAGVFGTPQILMASGVGPADVLDPLNIPIIAERPGVGQNLQDHVFTALDYRVDAPTLSALKNPVFAAEQAELFNNNGTGMYTSTNTEVVAFEKIPDDLRQNWSNETKEALAAYPADWPEVEYISTAAWLGQQEITAQDGPKDGNNYGALAFVLIAPRSRGTVNITSTDTKVAPVIDPQYLSVQSDKDIMVAAFKRAQQFFAAPALSPHLIGQEMNAGPNVTTDAEIEDFVAGAFNTIWHGVGTAAMGQADDTQAVVDPQGRVYGVQGLRVVDASAFPMLVPGHPMSTIYALAEKIACDISANC